MLNMCLMVLQYAHQTSFVIITRLRNFQLLELPDEILRLEYFFWAHWKDSYHLYLKGYWHIVYLPPKNLEAKDGQRSVRQSVSA